MFPPHEPNAGGQFASTQWSVVLAARDAEPARAREALSALFATYWRPLYLYVRRSGRAPEDAQDLTQGFFTHLLEKESLRHVDPGLGKFRAFLLASLKNYMTNERRRDQAQKRGGAASLVSLEEVSGAEAHLAVADGSLTPEQQYERNWALAMLSRATARLEAEFQAAGKSRIFECLKPYLAGDRETRYAEAAARLGISEVTVRVAVHRMRGRFRDLLQEEVSQTLADPGDAGAVEQELRFLLAAL
jgi:RNA polymerase sigma-70 factor (ECF subfamily)